MLNGINSTAKTCPAIGGRGRRGAAAGLLLAALLLLPPGAGAAADDAWQQYADPAQAGFSTAGLDAARELAESVGSGAVMVVRGGHVVAAWGPVDQRWKVYSVRKSLLGALWGAAVEAGHLTLDTTLEEAGLASVAPLTDAEAAIEVRHLLTTSSGVYLKGAKEPPGLDENRPARGSSEPGERWWYNNWDFNATAHAWAQATGRDPLQAFATDIAEPIGMEDFRVADTWWEREPLSTDIPAWEMRTSTRDLARFGQLYLQRGEWNGRRVVPAAWVDASFTSRIEIGGGATYGYLWWIDGHHAMSRDAYPHLEAVRDYAAVGSHGQSLLVVPELDLVVVHRGATDHGRRVDDGGTLRVIEAILAARTGDPVPDPELTTFAPEPFPYDEPPMVEPTPIAITPEELAAYAGEYVPDRGPTLTLFMDRGELFVSIPGRPEVRIQPYEPDVFFSRSVAIRLTFEREGDRVMTVRAFLPGVGELLARRGES